MEPSKDLVYHTFFGEFRGANPEDVVQALYKDSAAGTGQTYSAWWAYQRKLWGRPFGQFPKEDQDNACAQLLQILVKARALEFGPKPQPVKQNLPGVTYG